MTPPPARPGLAVAALSAALFLTQLLLTRLFSVTLFHHFAFAAISIGMLGLAAAGVRVALAGERYAPERAQADVLRATLLFAATLLVALLVMVAVGAFPSFSWANLARVLLVYVACLVPFSWGGLALTLLFTHGREQFGRLYALDLLAAGLSALVAFPLLRAWGAPAAVALVGAVALLLVTLALPGAPARLRRLALGLALVLLAVVAGDAPLGLLRLRQPKGGLTAQGPLLFEAWNAFSRVAVYDAPLRPWSLSPLYRGPVAPALHLDIDAAAATGIVPAGAGEGNAYLDHELTALGWSVARPGRALVIGAGGGRDVLAALRRGAQTVDAVEINPIIARDVMLGRFRDYSGGLYADPRVRLHVADGRSFVRRSRERWDFVQLTLVDTWAATAAGAFALTENNLYTREAVAEYLDRLAPDGVLTLTRWTGFETLRLVALVDAAARAAGIADPGRHTAVVMHPGPRQVEPVVLIFRLAPFDEASLAPLRAQVEADGFAWLHDPLRALPGEVSALARSADAAAELRRTRAVDLSPPSDDRPFFFYTPRPLWAGLRESPARLFTEGQYLLVEVLLVAALLASASVLLPLARRGREALHAAPGLALRAIPYFACLGVGFMLVELGLMQRSVLFLGHPTHAMAAVVASLLLGAGAGAGLAQRARGLRPAPAALGAALLLLLVERAQGPLFALTQPWELPAKVVLTAALVLPLGAALGTLLPLGMARLVARAPGLVPWAWGINGLMSVVGVCAGALLAMGHGFTATFQAGAACYLLAALVAALDRGPSPAPQAPGLG